MEKIYPKKWERLFSWRADEIWQQLDFCEHAFYEGSGVVCRLKACQVCCEQNWTWLLLES